MKWREAESGIFFPTSTPVSIDAADLEFLVAQAQANPRRRARLCAHPESGDGLHEMIICLHRDGYVRPHRHFKCESASIIAGACDLVLFDEQGNVSDVKELSAPDSNKPFFVRLGEPLFHTYLLHTDHLLFLETTPGPLDRTKTEFAPWSPADLADDSDYVRRLEKRVLAWKQAHSS